MVIDAQVEAVTAQGPLERIYILETVVGSVNDAGFLVVTSKSEALANNDLFLEIWNIPRSLASDNQAMMQHVLNQLVHPQ